MKKIERIRHSLAHLLAAAVLEKFPNAKLGIGPVIENGFYYDFDFNADTGRLNTQINADNSHSHQRKSASDLEESAFGEEYLSQIETRMKELIKQNLQFKKEMISYEKAKKLFKNQPYKLELIKELQKKNKKISIYKTFKKDLKEKKEIDVFVDLCAGFHIKSTNEIDPSAFKLTQIAAAYWRGDEKNPQLQRIYGVAFENKKELDDYLYLIEEAKKRDHRKLGKELKLFTIIDEVGAGLPLFYPKGAILRRIVENFIIELQEKHGYVPIWVPHLTKAELYKISGHLDKYEAMYPPLKLKNEGDYYLKPMNCPHFMMLYKSEPHSYKDLPLRYTATTTVYRYEKSGELLGLTRVRALTQDDCHVFATPFQISSEINLMLDMIEETYKAFGFKEFWVRISLHNPKEKGKYIGDFKIWKQSEEILKKLVIKRGWKKEIGVGEAAFYGPKLDFMIKDALGRAWQLSTIQLDMNLPKRFQLEYINEKGKKSQPIVIHRAILGSTERFLAILIEHYAGALPLWLAPIQVEIINIGLRHRPYANFVRKQLMALNIRTNLSDENLTVSKRIRNAEIQKIPYILVVGNKELKNKTVNVRHYRRGLEGEIKIDKLIEKIEKEIKNKTI